MVNPRVIWFSYKFICIYKYIYIFLFIYLKLSLFLLLNPLFGWWNLAWLVNQPMVAVWPCLATGGIERRKVDGTGRNSGWVSWRLWNLTLKRGYPKSSKSLGHFGTTMMTWGSPMTSERPIYVHTYRDSKYYHYMLLYIYIHTCVYV